MTLTPEEQQERKEFIIGLARKMMELFPPSPDAHGRLSGWAKDDKGVPRPGSKQQYTENRTPVLKDYIYHLVTPQSKEPRGIGVYPTDYKTKTVRFIVIDIDEDSDRARQAILGVCNMIKLRGGFPFVERTTQNRWHLWYFPERAMPMETAKYVAMAMKSVAKPFRCPVEIYPATYYPDPMPRAGKYVNLPYRGSCYSLYTGKPSDYDMIGVTALIDPYGDDDGYSTDDGQVYMISMLGDIQFNPASVTRDLERYGRECEREQERREKNEEARRKRNTVGRRVDGKISFQELLDKLYVTKPGLGDRHTCILACAGVARNQHVDKYQAIDAIAAVARSWGGARENRDWRSETQRAVESTYSKPLGTPVIGLPTLIKLGIITV